MNAIRKHNINPEGFASFTLTNHSTFSGRGAMVIVVGNRYSDTSSNP